MTSSPEWSSNGPPVRPLPESKHLAETIGARTPLPEYARNQSEFRASPRTHLGAAKVLAKVRRECAAHGIHRIRRALDAGNFCAQYRNGHRTCFIAGPRPRPGRVEGHFRDFAARLIYRASWQTVRLYSVAAGASGQAAKLAWPARLGRVTSFPQRGQAWSAGGAVEEGRRRARARWRRRAALRRSIEGPRRHSGGSDRSSPGAGRRGAGSRRVHSPS